MNIFTIVSSSNCSKTLSSPLLSRPGALEHFKMSGRKELIVRARQITGAHQGDPDAFYTRRKKRLASSEGKKMPLSQEMQLSCKHEVCNAICLMPEVAFVSQIGRTLI